MFRTAVWFLGFGSSLVFFMPMLIRLSQLKDASERAKLADGYAKKWSKFLLWIAGAKVIVIGEEKIPVGEAVVYVANHQSNFDIPLILAHLPKNKGFIAKVETLKIPLVWRWMKHMKCVFIDREDMRQQVKAIGEGIAYIKSGQSMVIFPEGTRSATGHLGDFKPGSLKLATKSGATIVPIAIDNSMGLMKKGSNIIKPSHVTLKVLDPISITPEMNRETPELAANIRAQIERSLFMN